MPSLSNSRMSRVIVCLQKPERIPLVKISVQETRLSEISTRQAPALNHASPMLQTVSERGMAESENQWKLKLQVISAFLSYSYKLTHTVFVFFHLSLKSNCLAIGTVSYSNTANGVGHWLEVKKGEGQLIQQRKCSLSWSSVLSETDMYCVHSIPPPPSTS